MASARAAVDASRASLKSSQERLQMLLGGVGRTEAKGAGDFFARGGCSAFRQRAADEFEDLALAGGEQRGFVAHKVPVRDEAIERADGQASML
jgi:hypothetical protein